MKEWVALLDCNNFFVSCERLFRPDLVGKPVVVLSSNDGCVVARSQEVKDMGIPMGVPYFKIKDILKTNKINVFSGNPTLYRDISKRVFRVMKAELDYIEQYSVDEAFFKIVSEEPEQVARNIKDKVEREVGIPVSIGVGPSKTLAKLAAHKAKRESGVFHITEPVREVLVKETSLAEVWGVGRGMSERFRKQELIAIEDLLQVEDRQLQALFGVAGLRLKKELSGEFVTLKAGNRAQQKSLMSSRTLKENTSDIAVLRTALANHINSVAEDLRKMNLKTKYLKIYILPSRFGDFALQNASKEVFFETSTNTTTQLLTEANKALNSIYKLGVPYKKVGVLTADLQSAEAEQFSLFDPVEVSKVEELQASVDEINKHAKGGKIFIGKVAHDVSATPKSERRSPAYTTKWTDLVTVKA